MKRKYFFYIIIIFFPIFLIEVTFYGLLKFKMIDKNLSFKIENSVPNIFILNTSNYKFQNNDCLLGLEFSNEKLYKVSLHFTTSNNQASINDYINRANLIMDVYGKTKKNAIGRESDKESSRKTSMSIGELTYQHRWETLSGKLTYQIGSGSYGKFIHSFFYSSKQASEIDAKKLKSEF